MSELFGVTAALFGSRSAYWWANQTGISFEIIGALLIVLAAFWTRKRIRDIRDTWDAKLPERLRDIVSNQAFTELLGFGLLALGLVLQMIGAFGA